MNIEFQALVVNLIVFLTGALILIWVYQKSKKKNQSGCNSGGCGCSAKNKKINWIELSENKKDESPSESK